MQTLAENVPPDWSEERLRYRILRAIYDRTGADCVRTMTATEIGAYLSIGYEDLYRVIHWLAEHEYLFPVGEGPRVCVTPKGIRYIEKAAGRRMTIRTSAPAL
jgi:hypothetical protein